MSILGVDAGNSNVKIVGEKGELKFTSIIGEWRERKLKNSFKADEIEWQYDKHSLKKGFAGSLAEYEAEYGGSILGDTKAHEDTLLRVVLAIHRYITKYHIVDRNFSIVIGQPISRHDPDEKQKLIDMIEGLHEIEVNGELQRFRINAVKVAAEGGAAFWASPSMEKVHIIDAGGGTINLATLNNKRYVDRDSATLTFGMDSNKSSDISAMVRKIKSETIKLNWKPHEKVIFAGGGAEALIEYFDTYFHNTTLIQPKFQGYGSIKILKPIYANALGFYNIAKGIFNNAQE